MAIAYKLAQTQGTTGVASYATLYNTGAASTAVISSISICNTASAAATYRIGVMGPTAGSPGAGEWIVNGATVPGNDTVFLTVGLSLGNTKYLRVSSSANTVDFSASIAELT